MKNTWEKFYTKRGRFYLTVHPFIQKLITIFRKRQTKIILDLGCGTGRHIVELAKNGFKVYGIDYSETALSLAKKWLDKVGLNANLIKGNINKPLEFEDCFFDSVLAIDSLQYGNKNLTEIMEEIDRILIDQGLFFLTLPLEQKSNEPKHKNFPQKDVEELLEINFRIIQKFTDSNGHFCVLAEKKRKY